MVGWLYVLLFVAQKGLTIRINSQQKCLFIICHALRANAHITHIQHVYMGNSSANVTHSFYGMLLYIYVSHNVQLCIAFFSMLLYSLLLSSSSLSSSGLHFECSSKWNLMTWIMNWLWCAYAYTNRSSPTVISTTSC